MILFVFFACMCVLLVNTTHVLIIKNRKDRFLWAADSQ